MRILLLLLFAVILQKSFGQCISDDPASPACNTIISTDPRGTNAVNHERPGRTNKFNWMNSTFNVNHPAGGYTGVNSVMVNPYFTSDPYLGHLNYYSFPLDGRTPDKLDFYPEDGWELIHKGNGYQV